MSKMIIASYMVAIGAIVSLSSGEGKNSNAVDALKLCQLRPTTNTADLITVWKQRIDDKDVAADSTKKVEALAPEIPEGNTQVRLKVLIDQLEQQSGKQDVAADSTKKVEALAPEIPEGNTPNLIKNYKQLIGEQAAADRRVEKEASSLISTASGANAYQQPDHSTADWRGANGRLNRADYHEVKEGALGYFLFAIALMVLVGCWFGGVFEAPEPKA